jgi:hypothetical protein
VLEESMPARIGGVRTLDRLGPGRFAQMGHTDAAGPCVDKDGPVRISCGGVGGHASPEASCPGCSALFRYMGYLNDDRRSCQCQNAYGKGVVVCPQVGRDRRFSLQTLSPM